MKVRSQTKQFFSPDAEELLTPFRARTLEMMYDVAKKELGSSLKSATVVTWCGPEDEVSDEVLVLSIIAKAERPERKRTQKAILGKIAEESSSWSDEEKEDYRKKIYFELIPFDL